MKRFPALAILYYGFTVIIGAILVFYFLTYGATNKMSKELTKCAEDSKFLEMTQLLSVYQDPNVVLEQTLDDGTKFAIYQVDATYSKTVDDTKYVFLEKGYMGLITNPGSNWVRDEYTDNDGVKRNNFGLLFNATNTNGETVTYNYRIGYVEGEKYASDTEESTIKNRWYSYETCKFYYFMIGDEVFEENNLSSISSFSFVNANSTTSATINFNTPLTLESSFFTKMTEFNTKYNQMVLDNVSNSEINDYVDSFNSEVKSLNYTTSIYAETVKYVPMQNALKIVGYFLAILIIGDFLVGKHRIIHLFAKIFKKNKSPKNAIPEYMDDYSVNVTFKAIVGEGENANIVISYVSESGNLIKFNLTKSNNYEETKQIKNGTYINPHIETTDLVCEDVPSSLTIKGFKYYQEFTFIKK